MTDLFRAAFIDLAVRLDLARRFLVEGLLETDHMSIESPPFAKLKFPGCWL